MTLEMLWEVGQLIDQNPYLRCRQRQWEESWLQVQLDWLDVGPGGETSTAPSVVIVAAMRCRLAERISRCADEEPC